MPNTITPKQHDLEPSPRATLLSGTGVNEADQASPVRRRFQRHSPHRRRHHDPAHLHGHRPARRARQLRLDDARHRQRRQLLPGVGDHVGGSRPQTVPNSSYNLIVIEDDLD